MKFLQLLKPQHIAYFCQIMEITQEDIKDIYPNPGRSANNTNFVFVVGKNHYLYRIPGKGTEKFTNRKHEALAYKLLSKEAITDEVIHLSPEKGIKISKFYQESRIPSSQSDQELKNSMKTLKRLHELDIDFPLKDTMFDRLLRYKDYVYEVGGEKYLLEDFDGFLEKTLDFKDWLETENIEMSFTHGDASINNLLITKEFNYPILIDMEFPALSYPLDDLATFSVDADYRGDMVLKILDFYLGRQASNKEKYQVLGLCAAAGLMWYSWAAYKCQVEEDNQLFINFRDDYHAYIGDLQAEADRIYNKI